MILRNQGIENVAIVGLTTEDCCFAAARDAMYRGYKVAFLSDVTGTYDYGDIGFGRFQRRKFNRVCFNDLGGSTAHVMKAEDFMQKVEGTEEVEQV